MNRLREFIYTILYRLVRPNTIAITIPECTDLDTWVKTNEENNYINNYISEPELQEQNTEYIICNNKTPKSQKKRTKDNNYSDTIIMSQEKKTKYVNNNNNLGIMNPEYVRLN